MRPQKPHRTRRKSIRWSLLRNISLLVGLPAALIMATTCVARTRAMRIVSRATIQHAADSTEIQLHRFFEPVVRTIYIIRDWARLGLLDTENVRELNAVFIPIMQQLPQVTSMMRSDLDGSEFLLLELADRWVNRFSRPGEWGTRTHWYEWTDAETPLKEYWKELDYDSSRRPWHQGAVAHWRASTSPTLESLIHWTEPYTFFTTKDPGITVSIVAPARSEKTYVVGLDIMLIDISRFTSTLRPSPGGMAFILTEDDKLIGLPRNERFDTVEGRKAGVMTPVGDLGIHEVVEAVRVWHREKRKPDRPFRYSSGGELWWAGYRPFQLSPNRSLTIGVILPERDFLTEFNQQRIAILCIALGFLALAIVTAVYMARRYSEPLEELVKRSERISELDLREHDRIDSPLLEIHKLTDAQERMRKALVSFSRYVPTEIVRELVHRGEAAKIGGRSETVTCLFSDVRGFTPIAESMAPEALTAHMADYFDAVLEVLRRRRATIDKLIGDAVFAFWGAPVADPEHSGNAVAAVLECRQVLVDFNERAAARGLPPLLTNFGLSAGPVMVGNVGSPSRLSYTAVGDVVNLASRLERVNLVYGTDILATEAVRNGASDSYVWRFVDIVRVKGKSRPVRICEPLGPRDHVSREVLEFVEAYEEALAHYQAGNFESALKTLGRLSGSRGRDPSLARLAELCRRFLDSPPPGDWDGVSNFDFK